VLDAVAPIPQGHATLRVHPEESHRPSAKRSAVRLEMGNTSSIRWIGAIGEYRINWGPGYRIYFAKGGDALIILLGGGTKKGQQRDIERAQALAAEYRARKTVVESRHKR